MEIIKNNPHRLLGVLVGTSPKVILSRVNNLKIYLTADDEIPKEELPYGFSRIGKIVRNLEIINSANSKLNISSEKILNSIFWFYEGTKIGDKEAFESMSEGDLEYAAEIWQAVIGDKDVNSSNASAFHNLSILKINASFKSSRVFVNILEEGVLMQLRFLESQYSDNFFSLFIDNYETQNRSKYQLVFLKAIQEELEKYESISSDKIFEIVAKIDFSAKDDFLKDSIQKPIRTLEFLINGIKVKRNENPRDAEIHGRELYNNSKELITQIKNVLGENNLKYKSISDKLAEEILQCGIDFFNEYKDEDFDPGDDSMELFEYAYELAIGELINQRVKENIEGIRSWIENAEEREKLKLIKDDLDYIIERLEGYKKFTETIRQAKSLVNNCWPKLVNIRKLIGNSDELYLNLSTTIASHALGTLVERVNREVNNASSAGIFGLLPKTSLITALESALDLTFKIGLFDLQSNFKTHYNKNLEGLKSLASQVGVSTLSPKEKVQKEINTAQSKLREIQNSTPLTGDIKSANNEMVSIKQWQFLRSQETRDRQIAEQTNKINKLKERSEREKRVLIKSQEDKIADLLLKLKQTEY